MRYLFIPTKLVKIKMSVNLSVGKYGESDKTTLKNMQYFVRFSYPCGLEKSIFSYKFKEISCTDLQGVIFKNVHGNTDRSVTERINCGIYLCCIMEY